MWKFPLNVCNLDLVPMFLLVSLVVLYMKYGKIINKVYPSTVVEMSIYLSKCKAKLLPRENLVMLPREIKTRSKYIQTTKQLPVPQTFRFISVYSFRCSMILSLYITFLFKYCVEPFS